MHTHVHGMYAALNFLSFKLYIISSKSLFIVGVSITSSSRSKQPSSASRGILSDEFAHSINVAASRPRLINCTAATLSKLYSAQINNRAGDTTLLATSQPDLNPEITNKSQDFNGRRGAISELPIYFGHSAQKQHRSTNEAAVSQSSR